MRLTRLVLEQFRNYQKLELDFNPDEPMTCIVGPNAQGKTNILESIYLLALTKSFRTPRQQDMIAWGGEYARVKGVFEIEGEPCPARPSGAHEASSGKAVSLELEAFLGKPPNPQRAFKKNNVSVGAANFIGNCQVVFFHPEDLNMLYLGPDLRRAWLNVINVQVNRKYFSALRSYQKVLKQRNALLHAIKIQRAAQWGTVPGSHTTEPPGTQHAATSWEAELNIWDEQLVEHGSCLMLERAKTVKYFQEKLASTYQKISSGTERVRIHYHHTIHSLMDAEISNADFADRAVPAAPANPGSASAPAADPAFAATSPVPPLEIWREHFARALAAARARDIQALVTTIGPHRDDLDFSFDGLRLASRASRGEYRSLLLALKLIELSFFEDRSGDKPILLLDDVFSELDPGRQNLLLQAIQGHQTIITATHLNQEPSRAATATWPPSACSRQLPSNPEPPATFRFTGLIRPPKRWEKPGKYVIINQHNRTQKNRAPPTKIKTNNDPTEHLQIRACFPAFRRSRLHLGLRLLQKTAHKKSMPLRVFHRRSSLCHPAARL